VIGCRRRAAPVAVAGIVGLLVAGCAAYDAAEVLLPPAGGTPDYQLGAAYPPAAAVDIVVRDRSADPAPDVYSICYVNGFQTQPGEVDQWSGELVLQRDGAPVVDPAWPDEYLLDTSTAQRRDAIAEVVAPWIEGCADAGFDAVEFDNLDSYTRSDGALTFADNLALATTYVRLAHDEGLAAGQKNAAEDAQRLHDDAGFDFAVAEECAAYDECGEYAAVYGTRVIDIEYTDELPRPFADLCDEASAPSAMVLRDRDLVASDDPDYAFELCEAAGR
jgi:hypothetical protein